MAFDPDAYLNATSEFNPDEYLKEDPNKLSSKEKEILKRQGRSLIGATEAGINTAGNILGSVIGTALGGIGGASYALQGDKFERGFDVGMEGVMDTVGNAGTRLFRALGTDTEEGEKYTRAINENVLRHAEALGPGLNLVPGQVMANAPAAKGQVKGAVDKAKSRWFSRELKTGNVPVEAVLEEGGAVPTPSKTLTPDARAKLIAEQQAVSRLADAEAAPRAERLARAKAADESQVAMLEAALAKRNEPQPTISVDAGGTAMVPEQMAARRAADADAAIAARQAEMEQAVRQRTTLEMQAAERARQEAASTGFDRAQLERASQEAAQTYDFVSRAKQIEIDDTPYGMPGAQFGSTLEHGRIDENGIPIRADLSIEAQQLQNPLQRNLWGDELGTRTGDGGIGMTQALDRMPPGPERQAAINSLIPNVKQRGVVNTNLLKWADEPFEKDLSRIGPKYAGMTLKLQTSPAGPELSIVKDGKEVASLYTTVKGDNLEVGRVWVDSKNREQGLAGLMYDALNYMGNDIKRSEYQLPDGKAMWDKWEATGKSVGGMRRAVERGAIDAEEVSKLIRSGYEKFSQKINDLGKTKLPVRPSLDDNARSIPGMGDALNGLFVKPKAAADILPNILAEKDGPPLWKAIQQGLSVTGEKVGSSLMRYTSDWLNYVDKKSDFEYKQKVKPTEKMLTNLGKDQVPLAQVLLNEMFNKKRFTGDELVNMNLTPKQIQAYKALRENLDWIADRYDVTRAALGKEPIDRGEAYVAATRNGNYHVVLEAKNADGTSRPVWHVASNSRREAYKFINWAKENLKNVPGIDLTSLDKYLQPGVIPGSVSEGPMYRKHNKFYNVPRDILGAHLELAKLVDGTSPEANAIREAIQAAAEKAGYDVGTTKQRFMQKANIRGFNGDKPWLTPEENARSLLNSQLNTIKEGLNWVYHQEMVGQLKETLSNPELQAKQPNNVAMVNTVLQQQLGLSKSILKDAEDFVAHHVLGTDSQGYRQFVRDMKVFTIMQQLGMSVGYMLATPLQSLNSVGAALREFGLKALSPSVVLKTTADGMTAMVNDFILEQTPGKPLLPMTQLGKNALQYAEDNGIINKLVMSADNQHIDVGSNPSIARRAFEGTMSIPEKASRLLPYMAFVHHLAETGKYTSQLELFKRAEELTDFTQINFRGHEKPTFVRDLGGVGEMAYLYKGPILNYMNQLSTYSRNVLNGKDRGKNAAALAGLVGATAFLGGALALPGMNEADGMYNLYKDAIAKFAPETYKSDLGIKGALISKLPDAVAYGAISEATGAQMSSRFAPNFVDMEHPLGGITPIGGMLSQQGNTVSALINPTAENITQAIHSNAPPMVKGWMETEMDMFKGAQRPDGRQVYLNPNDFQKSNAMVVRTPEQETYRKLGLRELSEARKVDLNRINQSEQRRVEKVVDSMMEKMFAASIKKDTQAVRKYGSKILEMQPDAAMFNRALSRQINDYAFTPEERELMKADVIQNLQKIKRLRDAAR